MKQIEAGELFMTSSGETSDYGYELHDQLYRALKEINLEKFTVEFLEANRIFSNDIGKWLVQNGQAEEIDYSEINIGWSNSVLKLYKKENK